MTIILSSFRARMHVAERTLAVEALKATGGNVTAAALMVGLHHTQLRRIIERHQLAALVSRHAPRSGNAAWRALGEM
jgi:transcriptional regulator with GAF, ATPase, and Fis domain